MSLNPDADPIRKAGPFVDRKVEVISREPIVLHHDLAPFNDAVSRISKGLGDRVR
jgi:hypothetical protein